MRKRISEVLSFLENMKNGTIKKEGLLHIKRSLENSLNMNVFVTSLDKVYYILNIEELKNLLKGGTIRQGSYSPIYKEWKLRHFPYPHEVTGILKENTFIQIVGDEVQMFIPQTATTRGGKSSPFNFGPIHERRKSILKSTVYFAWKDIKNRLRNLYKRFIESA